MITVKIPLPLWLRVWLRACAAARRAWAWLPVIVLALFETIAWCRQQPGHRASVRYAITTVVYVVATGLVLGCLSSVAPGCSQLTPFEGAALTALDVGACSALVAVSVAIPVPGAPALVAGACAGEEAAVGAAIAHAEVVVGPTQTAPIVDAGAPLVAVHPDGGTVAVGALLYRGTGKERHIAGACPEGWDETKRKIAQAHLDAAGLDGGR